MSETSLSFKVNSAALKEATTALNELAEAADRAKVALDKLNGPYAININVSGPSGDELVRQHVITSNKLRR